MPATTLVNLGSVLLETLFAHQLNRIANYLHLDVLINFARFFYETSWPFLCSQDVERWVIIYLQYPSLQLAVYEYIEA